MAVVSKAVEMTKKALEDNPHSNWILGFSGGKDSSAMLKIFTAAAKRANPCPREITLIYCDTGVENPILDKYVHELFGKLDAEFAKSGVPFRTKILKAPISDRFFVKVIGRGYPTPTNKFRWCTDKLRVNPVTRFIAESSQEDAIVCLGLRASESLQRDRTLERYGNQAWQNKAKHDHTYRVYLPILELKVEDVWDVIFMGGNPKSIEGPVLDRLYRGAAGECPILRPPKSAACGTGRFGCWTCTVVRQDKSMMTLIQDGHSDLAPYLEFRNWLAEFRDNPAKRWKTRRNGTAGVGPFTLAARKEILERLDHLSNTIGAQLIEPAEREEIGKLWKLDEGTEPL